MSEYSRWSEWRSTATTAKPNAGHAKGWQPPPSSRARRQGLANDSTPAHTKCAAHAEPAIDSWYMYAKCTACAEPSRQDRRHAASRQDWSLGGTHADSTPAHAKQAVRRRQRRASHRLRARAHQVRRPCRAEPPRQAARRRLHARARQVRRHRGHTRGRNVQLAQSKDDAES